MVVPAGDSAMLVEFEDRIDPAVNARAIAAARRVSETCPPGVRDVVPSYRSVAVYFDPVRTDAGRLSACLEAAASVEGDATDGGRTVNVPVCYGDGFGPDLGDVARFAGMSEDAVVAVHTGRDYRVFMLGFMPGFAYMGVVDPAIAMPRLITPRRHVPAGSVGIAGPQTGVYPMESPGGWQLIGRTPIRPFDASRVQPFLFAAGDRVRFASIDRSEFDRLRQADVDLATASGHTDEHPAAYMTVVRPGLLTTVQDLGRWGYQAWGVPVAGPMDPWSHRAANVLVGNAPEAAVLEITLSGPELAFSEERVVAVTGAQIEATLDGRSVPQNRPFVAGRGTTLAFGPRVRGARAYIAVSGGITVPPVLGSRATHVGGHMGGLEGRALRAGDRLPLGVPRSDPSPRHLALSEEDCVQRDADGTATASVRVLAGPQEDRFIDGVLDVLQSDIYRIAPDSDRMGFRLVGPRLRHRQGADVISDATPLGSLQVPASEQPVLLMADRQTTGGYAKVATVIAADIGIVGQLVPGDAVRFQVCTRDVALTALVARERRLLGGHV
jgi:KipI family sensor histidine kinase inhibitor